MHPINIKISARQTFPYFFMACWSLLLLANFLPTIPQPTVVIGYLWKAEFALAAFLLGAIIFFLRSPKETLARFSRKEFFLIILPLLLFTIWSGFSIFWAESQRDAVHHTLLWACYLVFYLLIRHVVDKPKPLAASIKITGLVLLTLGAACIAEYVNNPEQVSAFFTFRYYKYAEASITLLPVFLALALHLRKRMALLSGAVAIVAWLIALLCLSRTVFISGVICVALFFALVFFLQDRKKHLRKSMVMIGLLAVCVLISQINLSAGEENTTLERFKGSEHTQTSFRSRFLFWGIAVEAFKESPLVGVGGDNYLSAYPIARERLSTQDPENPVLEIGEAVLPERAHNEYLQVLSELGIIGAALFAWLLIGIGSLFFPIRNKRVSLLSIAAFAGGIAFLVSSMASSYSFRVPANGLCFFFLAALAARHLRLRAENSTAEHGYDLKVKKFDLRPVFALIICAAMLVFSSVRGASLMYLEFALRSSDETQSERFYKNAIALDKENAAFRYYYGVELYNNKRTDEAIPHLRFAIGRGIATSVAYFNLASAQNISRKPVEARNTFAEAVRIYPRSAFLRTSFAAFLKENGDEAASQVEYETALRVNPEQTKSWWLAHTVGFTELSKAENDNKGLVKAMDLQPAEAIYALLDFQRQFNPNLVRR